MKETKDVIALGTSLIKAIEKSYADGKLTWVDFPNFNEVLTKIGPAVIGSNRVIDEIRQMTEAQKKDLIEFTKKEFDLGNDKVESIVESIALGLFHFAFVFKILRENKKE